MGRLSFGQPDDGIIQLAYVVPDLPAAMKQFTADLRAGPWFTLKHFAGVNPTYRGRPATAFCDLAFGFAGHVQIELICPLDSEPSVWRELVETKGYGFHHWGVATRDIEADTRRLVAKGYEVAFTSAVQSGGRVAYFDTKGALPVMMELIEVEESLEKAFLMMHQASLNWDGSDSIRPMPG